MKAVRLAALAATMFVCPMIEAGQLGQANTPSGSAFASACAGYGIFSGLGAPGLGYNYQENGASGTGYVCSNQTSTGTAFATATPPPGDYFVGNPFNQNYPYNSSATSSASVGSIHVQSSNQSEPIVFFPGGGGNGGWNDTITINGGTGDGIWVFGLHVDGSMSGGVSGSGTFLVGAYQNLGLIGGDYVPGHPSSYDTALNWFNTNNVTHVGTEISSWDYEMVGFGVSGVVTSLNVDEDVFFAVPFTYGTPFELGVYAADLSGETGFGANPTEYDSSVSFQHTVKWDSPGFILGPENQHLGGFTIDSGSGFDYNTSGVPEPSTWLLMLGGLGAAIIGRRFV